MKHADVTMGELELPLLLYRVAQVNAIVMATLLYCVLVVKPRRPGMQRFMASIPAFIAFGITPVLVKEVRGRCMPTK